MVSGRDETEQVRLATEVRIISKITYQPDYSIFKTEPQEISNRNVPFRRNVSLLNRFSPSRDPIGAECRQKRAVWVTENQRSACHSR